MPAKPRHRKGRLSPQARQRREEMRGAVTVTQGTTSGAQPAPAQPAAARPSMARSPVRPAKGTSAPGPMQMMSHQQVGSELRTIGIITAVLVVILVVLSFVIH
jgi:hypothetical protein